MIVARLAPPAIAALWLLVSSTVYPSGFTIEQVLSAPFASDIVAAPAGREFAWVSDSRGRNNVWLAAASGAAGFTARALTHYAVDDGLAIEDLAFVPHHDALLFVRGGDPDYPDKPAPNPAQITAGVVQTVYLVDFRGRAPVKLGEGHAPVASPHRRPLVDPGRQPHRPECHRGLSRATRRRQRVSRAELGCAARVERHATGVPGGERRLAALLLGAGKRRRGAAAHAGAVRDRIRRRERGRQQHRLFRQRRGYRPTPPVAAAHGRWHPRAADPRHRHRDTAGRARCRP